MSDIKNTKNIQFLENTKYEILSENNEFKKFDGLLIGESTDVYQYGSFQATGGHLIKDENGEWVKIQDITSSEKISGTFKVYDPLNIKDTHSYLSGDIIHHNCLILDEFAFLKPKLASEFIKSVFPVISSAKNVDSAQIIAVSCVTDDTFVITEDGIKEVSDFIDYSQPNNGDIGYEVTDYRVMGHSGFNDGKIMCNSGYAETRIISTTSSEIECSLKHPWFVCDNGKFVWKKTSELTGNEYVAIEYGHDMWGSNDSIDNIDINTYGSNTKDYIFNEITEDFAYFIGLYLSEGCVCKQLKNGSTYYTGITITCGDDVGELLGRLGFKYSCNDGIHYVISSKILCDIMLSIGFDLSNTATKKVIPKRLFTMSRNNIIAMIQGIMDGDGWTHGNRGIVGINLSSKRMIQQMRAIFNNFGILSMYGEGITKPTKKVRVESNFYRLELNKTMSKKYYDIIGFRFNRKQVRENMLPETISRDRHDLIPYSKDIITGLKHTNPEDYSKITCSGVMVGNYKKNSNFNRSFMIKNKELLLEINNPIINNLYEYISEDIKWEKIKTIKESNNYVYDFSLNETGSDWCHSVLFNNILGSNTPNGLNHYYKLYSDASKPIGSKDSNDFIPFDVKWDDVPGRDDAFRTKMIGQIGLLGWQQEYACIGAKTLVTVQDDEKNEYTLEIGELYELYNYELKEL